MSTENQLLRETLIRRMDAYLSGQSSEATAIIKDARAALAAQPAEGGEAVAEVPDLSESGQQRFFDSVAHLPVGTKLYTTPPASLEQAQQPMCECGDRPADQCTEQWGPECDLGNNEAHAKVAQQPSGEVVAWRTFDGEGGYEYRDFEGNENYADEWAKRNPQYKEWVEPLTLATPKPEPMTEENDEAAN